jgi:2-O-methyltransferase
MKFMKHYYEKFSTIKGILDSEDPVIVEIGAHYGEDSLRFTEIFANPIVYCFEPDPRNIDIFRKHIVDPRIILFEVALSDLDGEAQFFQSYDEDSSGIVPSKYDWIESKDYKEKKLSNSGSSSLKRGYKKILSESIQVRTSRFDTWCKENDILGVDLAWIDVQGAERDVINGMGKEIVNIKYIWIEYGEASYDGSMNRQETVSFMRNLGFDDIPQLSDKGSCGDILFKNARGAKL